MREHTRNQRRMYRIHKQDEKILEQELLISSLQNQLQQKENIIKGLDNTIENLEEVVEQKENIIKEVREKIEGVRIYGLRSSKTLIATLLNDILEILDKGSESNV